jgi:hypothetical protein
MLQYSIMNCSQTTSIYKHLNCKMTLLCIKFNTKFLKMRIIANYADIKILAPNMAVKSKNMSTNTKNKNKLKFVYRKK